MKPLLQLNQQKETLFIFIFFSLSDHITFTELMQNNRRHVLFFNLLTAKVSTRNQEEQMEPLKQLLPKTHSAN